MRGRYCLDSATEAWLQKILNDLDARITAFEEECPSLRRIGPFTASEVAVAVLAERKACARIATGLQAYEVADAILKRMFWGKRASDPVGRPE